jgi:hypothetical protein
MNYIIIRSNTASNLAAEVNKKIKLDYYPLRGVSFDSKNAKYIQSLIKKTLWEEK